MYQLTVGKVYVGTKAGKSVTMLDQILENTDWTGY